MTGFFHKKQLKQVLGFGLALGLGPLFFWGQTAHSGNNVQYKAKKEETPEEPKGEKKEFGVLEISVSGKASIDWIQMFQEQSYPGFMRGSTGTITHNNGALEENTGSRFIEEDGRYLGSSRFYVFEGRRQAYHMFALDNSGIYVDILGKKDAETSYGMTVVLTCDAGAPKAIRQSYLTFRTRLGNLFLGNTSGVEKFMGFGASSIQAGSGGVFGNFLQIFEGTTGCNVRPGLVGATGYSTKFVYVSPRVGGLQAGISYTPNNQHTGEGRLNAANSPFATKTPFDMNSMALGVNYVYLSPGGLGSSLSFIGITGDTRTELWQRPFLERYPTRAFAIGANVAYKKLELGAEYICNGKGQTWKRDIDEVTPYLDDKSLPAKSYRGDLAGISHAFDLGAAYTWGKTKVSVGYFHSFRENGFVFEDGTGNTLAQGDIYSISLEHRLISGLMPYVELGYLKTTNPDAPYVTARQLIGARGLDGDPREPLDKGYSVPLVLDNESGPIMILGAKVSF